jgi:hypothetical protein
MHLKGSYYDQQDGWMDSATYKWFSWVLDKNLILPMILFLLMFLFVPWGGICYVLLIRIELVVCMRALVCRYVSGYKNRYQNFIRYLRELGDEVLVVTTHIGVPKEFYGAKVIGSWSLPCPWYKTVPLSLALSPRIYKEVMNFKPDIIHASSPGIMVFGALVIAKLLSVPVVMAYHTHVPM